MRIAIVFLHQVSRGQVEPDIVGYIIPVEVEFLSIVY